MVEAALARLHALFVNADTFGSLIDPVRAAEDAGLESVDWHEVAPLVQQALTAEVDRSGDPAAARCSARPPPVSHAPQTTSPAATP